MNGFFHLSVVCSAVFGTLSILLVLRANQRSNKFLAVCCGVTSAWIALNGLVDNSSLSGASGFFDLARMSCWYGYLLYLYRRTEIAPIWQIQMFGCIGLTTLTIGLFYSLLYSDVIIYSLDSLPIVLRLTILIFELLLIENLYFNLPENARWHVALPCVLLSGIACLDILLAADAALYHHISNSLTSARLVILLVIAPLLVLAAVRQQRWDQPVRLSRTAVFHSATLVLSGSVLITLALIGELIRHFNNELGWIAELSLIFSGCLGLLVFASSRSARSLVQRVVTRHFFADRYDYRAQWLQCISTLSGTSSIENLSRPARAIRVVADVVNSPNGALFVVDDQSQDLQWQISWNMPIPTDFNAGSMTKTTANSISNVIDLTTHSLPFGFGSSFHELGPLWLHVPLFHNADVIGVIVVGPPRVPFRLDQEVFDLLHILGREIGAYLAEQRATDAILQTRALHDYGKRFAFVAHDIKNVSSQLALLVQNAQRHLSNPEFQADMIETVQASVSKINALLQRLDQRSPDQSVALSAPLDLLEGFVMQYKSGRNISLNWHHDGERSQTSMNFEAFNAVLTHLVNNAIEATPSQPVEIVLKHDQSHIIIEIVDRGPGMSAVFIRDELFTPFSTSKADGSGIGAYQARELLTEAGGQLIVESEEGRGTTMRVILPKVGADKHNLIVHGLIQAEHA